VELTARINQVTSKHLAEVRQQYEQGLIKVSDMLDMVAEADKAEVQYLQGRFQYQTSIAVLINVMGKTQIVFEESMNESR
jgi:outer membrane protein TolC